MSTGNVLERGGGLKRFLLLSAATAMTALALSNPASAAVRADKAITVFHNIDMVGATGYNEGEEMTIAVFRNGVQIGSTTGPAVAGPEGTGLEVNHGPEGDPAPGDCWDGTTPDILPGDEIRVTGDGGTDTLVVPNVDFTTKDPVLVTADNQAQYPQAQVNDVVVEGVGFDQAGNPIPTGALEGEVRNVERPRYRSAPNEVVSLGGGAWRAIYSYGEFIDVQNADGITSQDVKQQKILTGEHMMVFAPLLQETYISDMGAETGPAPGCEGSPSSANAVTTFDDKAVNIESGSLVVGGTAIDNDLASTQSVSISLSDGAGGTLTRDATLNGSTWTTTFERADMDASLAQDATLTAAGTYNVVDLTVPGADPVPMGGATKQIQRDVVAPGEATATPAPKLYNSDQSVTLNKPADAAEIRYTIGENPADPTATTGTLYNNQQIQITSDQTIKAVTVDAAGNSSPVATFAYQIDKAAPGLPTSNLETGSYDGTQQLILSSGAADLKEIRYTTNGDDPDANSGQVYSGPIDVPRTTTFKAVAVDNAGNTSPVLTRTLTIRASTTTTLGMSTKNLKLGKTRSIQGAVSPNHANGSVELTIDRPGALPNAVRRLPLDAASRYGFTYKPNATGTYRVSVSFAGDADSLGSKSVTRSFRVVR